MASSCDRSRSPCQQEVISLTEVECLQCGMKIAAPFLDAHERCCSSGAVAAGDGACTMAFAMTTCINDQKGAILNFDRCLCFCKCLPFQNEVGVMYHWTPDENHFLIEDGGFKIPAPGGERTGAAFGRGIYGSPSFCYGSYCAPGCKRAIACIALMRQGEDGAKRMRKCPDLAEEWVVPHEDWVLPCLIVHDNDVDWSKDILEAAVRACLPLARGPEPAATSAGDSLTEVV